MRHGKRPQREKISTDRTAPRHKVAEAITNTAMQGASRYRNARHRRLARIASGSDRDVPGLL